MPYLSSIPWVVTSFTHKKRDLATLVHPTAYELSWFLMAYACSICSQVYWWHDKYRPRKPKYFNRVHTGYEWNKYNQTHYDHDNPPPKIVQGYKFNIFYPDLVDKSKAPTYSIEKDGSTGETCLIKFHAGPPYEDIVSLVPSNVSYYSSVAFSMGSLFTLFYSTGFPYCEQGMGILTQEGVQVYI